MCAKVLKCAQPSSTKHTPLKMSMCRSHCARGLLWHHQYIQSYGSYSSSSHARYILHTQLLNYMVTRSNSNCADFERETAKAVAYVYGLDSNNNVIREPGILY